MLLIFFLSIISSVFDNTEMPFLSNTDLLQTTRENKLHWKQTRLDASYAAIDTILKRYNGEMGQTLKWHFSVILTCPKQPGGTTKETNLIRQLDASCVANRTISKNCNRHWNDISQ